MKNNTLKKSRQRDAILANVEGRNDHPTADMIYMDIRKEIPNISLGTVYRNLSLLADLGEILRVSINGKAERFDGITNFHYHFVCRECNQILDLPMDYVSEINKLAQKAFPGQITGHDAFFYCYCPECMKRQQEMKEQEENQEENQDQ